jgi:hypothetical protein
MKSNDQSLINFFGDHDIRPIGSWLQYTPFPKGLTYSGSAIPLGSGIAKAAMLMSVLEIHIDRYQSLVIFAVCLAPL